MSNPRREKVAQNPTPPKAEAIALEKAIEHFLDSDTMKEYRKTLFYVQQTLLYQMMSNPCQLPSESEMDDMLFHLYQLFEMTEGVEKYKEGLK